MSETKIDNRTQRKYAQLPRGFRWFTEHCVLRTLDESDIARIWKAVMHPAFAHCWTANVPQSHAEVAEFVRAAQADWLRGTCYTMAAMRKQTHDFVGWVELRAHATERGVWTLDWFIHPKFVAAEVARDVLAAVADLMFSALDTQHLYANCPPKHALFEHLLNEAGFIELVPAGSLDVHTAKPRPQSLFHIGSRDWSAMHGAIAKPLAQRAFSSTWVANTLRHELALI
jgi:RimJ/RimL family protein N-acetyltransferase